MAWKINSRGICIIILSPLIMSGPIFGIMNGLDFRSVVYLILALAGLKMGRGNIH